MNDMKHIIIIIAIAVQLIFVSCSEEEPILDSDLRFDLRITNLLGESQKTFNEGETIVFRFEVNNPTNEQIMLSQFRNDEFFKLVTDDGTEVGYPYLNYFCDFRAGITIAGGSTYSISIPWDAQSWNQDTAFFTTDICGVPGNNSLSKGTYTTGFEQKFSYTMNGDIFNTKELSFEQEFIVR